MRLTISNKILIIFAVTITISLSMGGGVFITLDRFASLRQNMQVIKEFQLQVKSLQYLRSEVYLKHIDLDDQKLLETFSKVQELAYKVDIICKAGDQLTLLMGNSLLSEQVEYWQQAYLELFQLYKSDLSFPLFNIQLLKLFEQRVSLLSIEERSEIQPLLTTLLMLQNSVHHNRSGNSLSKIKTIGEQLTKRVDAPRLLKGVTALIENIEVNYFNYLAIENREQFLSKTSANFETISAAVTAAITADIERQRTLLSTAVIILCLLLLLITTFFWLLSSRYFKHVLSLIGGAVTSIREGNFSITFPPQLPDDEFGDLALFIKEVAGSLKQNLAKVEDSEKKFRGLVENISDWVWAIDTNGVCTYCSPQAEDMLDITPQTIVGLPVLQIVGRKATDVIKDPFLELLSSQNPFDDIIHKVIAGDGQTVIFETSGRIVFDSKNRYMGYRFVSRDISDWRKAEEQLSQSVLAQLLRNQLLSFSQLDLDLETILKKFLGTIIDASWLQLEPSGAILLVNETGKAMELKAQKGLHASLKEACRLVPYGVCLCGRAAETGKVIFCDTVDERHEIRYDGMPLHGHYCVPIHSVAGEVIGVLTVYIKAQTPRDPKVETALVAAATILGGIIKRRQVEEKLFQLNLDLENQVASRTAQLTMANKELDTFAYSVSHDLRAPLRAVDGFSHALLEDYSGSLDEEGKNFIDRIRYGCKRMEQLIDEILKLSRLTRGDISVELLDLSSMAEDALKTLQEGDKKRPTEWEIAPNLEVYGDSVMIRAVLENLLGNAWKYSAKVEQPLVQFGCENQGDEKVFWVKDNGAGFNMKYKEKLFIAFQRLHSPNEFEGTGVGLATVQRIINRHGGKVWAESEEGKGATFFFSL